MFSVKEDTAAINKKIAEIQATFLKDKLSEADHLRFVFRKHQIIAKDVMDKISWINSDDTHEFLDPAVERLRASLQEFEAFINAMEN